MKTKITIDEFLNNYTKIEQLQLNLEKKYCFNCGSQTWHFKKEFHEINRGCLKCGESK